MAGNSLRHLKALCRKNAINWKRTLCGSICEVILPVMLMGFLMWARYEIKIVPVENYSLYSLRHPLYPIGRPGLPESESDTPNSNSFFDQILANTSFPFANFTSNTTNVDEQIDG